jgi:hypothetical protein
MQFLCVMRVLQNLLKSRICETPQLGYCKFCVGSVFHDWGGIAKPTHLMYVVHMGGLDQTIGPI